MIGQKLLIIYITKKIFKLELYIIKSDKIPDIYIGKTKYDTKTRFSQHKTNSKTKSGLLYDAMRKYGPENFEAIPYKPLLKKNVTEKELCDAETFLIKSFNAGGVKLLNVKSGGASSTKGRIQTVSAKALISESSKALWADPNYRDNKKNHKLTSKIAVEIRDLYISGKSRKEISETLGANYINVCHVIAGRKWHSITGIDSSEIRKKKEEKYMEIKRLHSSGEKTPTELSREFNINKTTIYQIIKKYSA